MVGHCHGPSLLSTVSAVTGVFSETDTVLIQKCQKPNFSPTQ